jgi:hypothetical protein
MSEELRECIAACVVAALLVAVGLYLHPLWGLILPTE